MPSKHLQTVRAAKLFALERALDMVLENLLKPWFELPEGLSRVVVIVDSMYVKSGVCGWVWEFEEEGWREKDGTAVVNGELFRQIHGHFEHLQSRGVEVNIWDVEKEQNTDAEDWARRAVFGGS